MAKTIDPIYKKYTSSVIKTLASTDFYQYFMDVIASGKTEYQFSNRRVEKEVDETWVKAIEAVIDPMQKIINNPRNFIMQEEIIVNVALAKKATPDTIQHLARHGDMIDSVKGTDVRPNRLMEKTKEDTWNTYENRFVYTLLEMAWDFVDKRYEAIFAALNEDLGAYFKVSNDSVSYQERIRSNFDLRIEQEEDLLAADKRAENIFARIARLHRLLGTFRASGFAREMVKYGKIRPPLVRTNAIAKNPNFKACHKLWNFILSYTDVGYKITIHEQSSELNDEFLQDINNSIFVNYVILKNHLDAESDRLIDPSKPFKRKTITPKYNKEIIEEIVKDYDLPDVEVRRVLIEEVTMERLMELEEAERHRLVEEQERQLREQREKEEAERKAREAEEERERIRLEKEKKREEERLERERKAEEERQKREQERKEAEEKKLSEDVRTELDRVIVGRDSVIEARQTAKKKAEAERLAKQKAEANRIAREKAEAARLAKQKAEAEKLAKEKAEAELAAKQQAEAEKKAERERKAAERKAAAQKAAAEKAEAEKKAAAEKAAVDEEAKAKKLAEEKQAEAERIAAEQKAQAERIEAERKAEEERIAREAEEAKRLADEEEEAERIAAEIQEQADRIAEEEEQAAKIAAQKQAEAERIAAERAEAERVAAEKKALRERIAAEKAEADRIAAEKKAQRQKAIADKAANANRIAAETAAAVEKTSDAAKAEAENAVDAAKAEAERVAAEKQAEAERIAAEQKAQAERIAAEGKAEAERIAAEEKAKIEQAAAQAADNVKSEANAIVDNSGINNIKEDVKSVESETKTKLDQAEKDRIEAERIIREVLGGSDNDAQNAENRELGTGVTTAKSSAKKNKSRSIFGGLFDKKDK